MDDINQYDLAGNCGTWGNPRKKCGPGHKGPKNSFLQNPVVQGVIVVAACSAGPGACAVASYGVAAFNSGVRFAQEGVGKETVCDALVDLAGARVKIDSVQTFREDVPWTGKSDRFPYGTDSISEYKIVSLDAYQLVKNGGIVGIAASGQQIGYLACGKIFG